MRTWLLLAAACAVGWAAVDDDKEIVRRVLQSWTHGRPTTYSEFPMSPAHVDLDADTSFMGDHHISKRSLGNVYAGSVVGQSCRTPGLTGANCEFPICGERNMQIPNNPESDLVSIDAANLANCSESYVVVVDETMFDINIEIETNLAIQPSFVLTAADGTTTLPTTSIPTPSSFSASYSFLAPGLYVLSPRADVDTTYCTMIMTAKTRLTVIGGFTSGPDGFRSDFPTYKYAYFDTISTVVNHVNGLEYPAQLQTIGFTGEQNHVTRSVPFTTRFNCSFPYAYERYTCSKNTPNDIAHNFYRVEGVTFQGFKFRRIVPYQCVLPPPTTTAAVMTTTAPGPVTTCKNGGQLIKNTDGTSYCYCIGYFGGSDCGVRQCLNGGVLPSPDSDRCTCQQGFSGFSCETIVCMDNAGYEFDAEHPTLTFVIRTRAELSNVVEQFVNATSQIVNDLSFAPNYLRSYIVVLFNNNALLLNKRYDTYGAALTDLNKAIHTAPSDGSCDDSTFSAIAAALSQYPDSKSPVYVITDATPSDSAEKETVFQLESFYRAPIYFIYITPPPSDNCNTSPENAGYRDYLDIATRTSGHVYYFSNRTNIYNFAYQHMLNTLYRSQLLLSNDFAVCGYQNVYKSVAIDSDVDSIVVVATGRNAQLLMTNPLNTRIDFNVMFSDGFNHIWETRQTLVGQWFFNIITQSPSSACSFRVYQKKFNNAVSSSPDFDLFWAFSTTLTSDGSLKQPIYNYDVAPVFHLTNYPIGLSMERVHAALSIYATRGGNQTEVYGSSGLWRDACSLHFYFPPFTCQVPEETLYFNFFARDRRGVSIQRAGTMYCTRVHPTPPPDHQCQNGGVMDPTNNTCFCTPEYTGQYCQTIVCYNGGAVVGNRCQCPAGWGGNSCEIPRCPQPGIKPEYLHLGVDMVFAVETTQQAWASLAMLNKNFQEILRDVKSQNPLWIGQFVVVAFNSTWGGVVAQSPSNDPTAVITALNNLAGTIPTDTGCAVQLWQALNSAIFSRAIVPGSYIEVFQTSPEDDTDVRNLGLLYEATRQMGLVLYSFVAADILSPTGFKCNATAENYYTMLGVVGGSTGDNYLLQPAEIANAVSLIPLQYSNAAVNYNFAPDCSTPLLTYIPVDAYTQTVQINVYGFNPTVTVLDGQGKNYNLIQLFYDDYIGFSVFEVRRACDDEWYDNGDSYCYRTMVGENTMTYPDAKKYCASAGGFLVDDLTSDKNQYLYANAYRTQFWIGLYNNNNGGYVWDRGNISNPQPLNQDQTFWAGDSTLDPTKQCVFFDGTSTDSNKVWTLDSCSTQRAFMCQKHRYDSKYVPNSIGDDDLPAGFYTVSITTQPTAGQTSNCSLEVRVQSDLQIVTGYVTSVGSDDPNGDPIRDSTSNRIIAYVHSLDNDNRVPILTDAALWDAVNGTFYNGLKYQQRVSCQYPWVTQDFPCPNGNNDNNEFGIMHIGEDEFGNTFQRVTYAHCSRAEIICGNGGVRYNGMCVCNDYWTGSQCTVPICVNGGTRNADQRSCSCPPGYTGRNCEFEMCQPKIDTTFSLDGKTLVLVVETTSQHNATVTNLIGNLANIISTATANNPNWFSNYGLITFDSSGVTYSSFVFTDANSLITALTAAQKKITDQGNCSMPLIGVLQTTLHSAQSIVYPNSEIILFTTAGASDIDQRGALIPSIVASQAQLHYVYSQTTCGDFSSVPAVSDITRLAYSTEGNVMFVTPDTVISLMTQYLPTRYGSSQLSDPTAHTGYSCSTGKPWYIAVDANTTFIYVSATSEFGSVSAVNPMGQTVAAMNMFNANSQKIYAFEVDYLPGIWTLQLSSPPGLCFVHVYAKSPAKTFAKFALPTASDPTGAHQDGSLISPVPGVNNIVAVELYGPPFHRGTLRYVDVYDPDMVKLLLRSELYPRGNCSYQYYSDPFVCQSDLIAINVYGTDENNQKFRRQHLAFCNGAAPTGAPGVSTTQAPIMTTTGAPAVSTMTPPPAVSTTQGAPTTTAFGNANLNFDVVFLFDGSQAAQPVFNNFTKFVSTLMVSYTVGPAAHVGIGVVAPDADDQAPMVAQLNSIQSQSILNGYLNTLGEYWGDFDHAGQLLDLNLKTVSSPDYMNPSAGYRPAINNHLIIYITATTAFDVDPTATAKSIIANNQYGIITVGFGAAVDNTKLIAVSGGAACSFTATDFASLNNQIRPIQQKIWDANFNNGVYCSS